MLQGQCERFFTNDIDIENSLRVKLLVEGVKTVDVTLHLSSRTTDLKSHGTSVDALMKSLKSLDTDILEGVLDTSDEICDKVGNGTTVKNRARDTLGNKQAVTLREVTSGTSSAGLTGLSSACLLLLHSVNGAHATISLDELAFLRDEVLARRLSGTGEQTAHHNSGSTHGETLDNVANVLDTAVSDAGNAEASGELGDVVDGSGLGTTDGHDLLSDTGGAVTHTDTETVNASSDEVSGLLAGDDVTADNIQIRVGSLDVLDHLDLEHGVTLRRVNNNDIQTSLDQLLQSLTVLGTSTDRGGADELLRISTLGGVGVMQVLGQIGTRKKRNHIALLVNDGELALLGLAEDLVGIKESGTSGGSDEVSGHDDGDGVIKLAVELDVTVGNDTEELRTEVTGL